MKRSLALSLFLVGLTGFTACQRSPQPAVPTPTPTPEPGYAGVAEPSPTSVTPQPSAEVAEDEAVIGEVEAPEQIDTDQGNAENQAVKAEVLSRIDVMPKLSAAEKDQLYVQVERARGMGKLLTIPFASGKTAPGNKEVEMLKEKLTLPQLQKFADDPTVVFVVLGFADKKGDEQKNLAISLQRAESVTKALKERCEVMNIVHSVGMGSSEMFDEQSLDKNRVVEVWVVLP